MSIGFQRKSGGARKCHNKILLFEGGPVQIFFCFVRGVLDLDEICLLGRGEFGI